MPVDYTEVLSVLGAMGMRHPQTTALGLQTYNAVNVKMADLQKVNMEYATTLAQSNDKSVMAQVGVLMQLAALHPWVIPLIVQTLSAWQTRIPDLIQMLNEFQAASVDAAKS